MRPMNNAGADQVLGKAAEHRTGGDRFAAAARLLAALTRGNVLVEAGLRSRSLTVLEHTVALGQGPWPCPDRSPPPCPP